MSSSPPDYVLPPLVTLASAEAIWAEWQAGPSPIVVRTDNLEQIDLAGLQLLAALRPCELAGASPVLDAALARAGMKRTDLVQTHNAEIGQ